MPIRATLAPPRQLPSRRPGEDSAAEPHPFAHFVRVIGRGQHLSRSLGEDEAAEAMMAILAGAVEPEQLGAFLLILRYRGETPEELAGFVRATRARLDPPAGLAAELDWPSYADRHKQLPYFLLAALLMAEAGVKTVMHGLAGEGPVTTPRALRALGLTPADTFGMAARQLERTNFAYLPVERLCPPLADLFALRPTLGVRSAANTFGRALNPLGASCQMQGVFHPTYLPVHRDTALRLGQRRAAIFKGGGGEVQRNPEKACRVVRVAGDRAREDEWPALLRGERFAWRDETLDPGLVVALWRGERQCPAAEAAVLGTAAIALEVLGRAETQSSAQDMAEDLWRERPKRKYGA